MEDHIVEEVRRIREEHAARFNYDIDAIFADLKRLEAESNGPRVPSHNCRQIAITSRARRTQRVPPRRPGQRTAPHSSEAPRWPDCDSETVPVQAGRICR